MKSNATVWFCSKAAASVLALTFGLFLRGLEPVQADPAASLRPPSVPLIACDPYFSVWSPADNLTDEETRHWTGKPQPLSGLLRVDGRTYRFLGKGQEPVLTQKSVEVLPTRTLYSFAGAGVELNLEFLTAALPEDLTVLSWPVTYVTASCRATDGGNHSVALHFDAAAALAVNDLKQEVVWEAGEAGGLTTLRLGSKDQPVLAKRGDDLRINWGYLYLAAPKASVSQARAGELAVSRAGFSATGGLPADKDSGMPRAAGSQTPGLALSMALGNVGAQSVSRWWIVAYDDLYSIQYFQQNLRPFWRRGGATAESLLKESARRYDALRKKCIAFDSELMADLEGAGGARYARIASLAYRQCLAASKLVADSNGQPLFFPKENFSNGCIGTVDVIYPMAPMLLLVSPSLTKAMLRPVMDYANSPRWRFPFAPHDLGQYPHANGQVYGGGERTETDQMPVEETANMLILLGALADSEGNAKFSQTYWPILVKWAEYLKEKGYNPENQLCTDDFAGHLAHNVNLSAKAICGLGAFARIAERLGESGAAQAYGLIASQYAARWIVDSDDGDHSRLTFDKAGTWSQKYNLVWDKILGLKLFPDAVLKKELAFYRRTQNRYGLPLDNRQPYTKLDWTVWTASLTGDRADFEALIDPVYAFLHNSPSRVPMSDWYGTIDCKQVGFQARSVVGGVFLPLLYKQDIWKKYVARDHAKVGGWAGIPEKPVVTMAVPGSDTQAQKWAYTTTKPGDGWFTPAFRADGWSLGEGGFGTKGTPGSTVRTEWKSSDIWIRREFQLTSVGRRQFRLWIHHDEDATVYINGILAATLSGYTSEYEAVPISPAALSGLKAGVNTIAIQCHQTGGGQYIDAGLVEVTTKGKR